MELLLVIVFLLLSGFFSGSETAFLTFDNFMVEVWRKKKRRGYKTVLKFVERPERYLSLTLVGTNISNVAYSSIATIYLLNIGLPSEAIFVLLPLVVLLLGEIIPKAVFLQLSNRIVLGISPVLLVFQIIMLPVIRITQWSGVQIGKLVGVDHSQEVSFFSVPDLEALIHEAEAMGIVNKQKRDLIHRTLHLQQGRVRDIMTPRTDIIGIEINSEVSEARKLVLESGYSKLLVYDRDLDHVVGFIGAQDFFQTQRDVSELVHPARVVPESVSLIRLLREMRKDRTNIALVVDEYGGTAGIVSMEDILEELVGDIVDEYDREVKSFRKVGAGTILATGRAEVDDINTELEEIIPPGDYITVAGWVLDRLGRIPATGDVEELDSLQVKILRADKNRIHALLIKFSEDTIRGENREMA